MADADEDAFLNAPAGSSAHDEQDDGEDEAQDFRLLVSLTAGSKNSQRELLKRGTKDFEPNPTQHQASVLDESRQAMRDALSLVRSQSEKNHNVGQFVDNRSEGHSWDLRLREGLNGQDWDDRCVVIYRFKGIFGRTIGRTDARSWTWLLPEEALYMLERGSLDIRWPDTSEQGGETDAQSDDTDTDTAPQEPTGELPMSLQGAYATFVGRSGLNMDRWLVYTHLRRLGYVVLRAPSWNAAEELSGNGHLTPTAPTATHLTSNDHTRPSLPPPSLLARLIRFISNPRLGTPCPAHGPLLAPGLHRSYHDIYRSLALVPYHTITTSSTPTAFAPQPSGPFSMTYDVWRPSSPYKKTSAPPPDFSICVLDARATHVPSMTEIGGLLDTMPMDEVEGQKRTETKIKHGKRNVILAVVDIGVVSYLRVGEACIGDYKIYESKLGRGSKGGGRGGRGGARGRGGGRGRGRGR